METSRRSGTGSPRSTADVLSVDPVSRRGPPWKLSIQSEAASITGATLDTHVHVSLDGGAASTSSSTSKLPLASPDSRTIRISYSPNRIRALSGSSVRSRYSSAVLFTDSWPFWLRFWISNSVSGLRGGQLFAGHPGVGQGEGAGLGVASHPEGVLRRVSALGPQREQLVEALDILLRMVQLYAQATTVFSEFRHSHMRQLNAAFKCICDI
ncbi:hypothetical protein EYF80_043473 [Liparis tanakae]|uniref:Uncharacterized protein n=1 Tax=Liparis tanakae TaxID=230148 RepID=A0A4Z2G0H1_9TELE|nr:hypothetical protein EYF80_043473 [Liparis tanakae]